MKYTLDSTTTSLDEVRWRIKRVGDIYYVQKRLWLFWITLKGFFSETPFEFHSEDEARAYIEGRVATDKKERDVEYIYP